CDSRKPDDLTYTLDHFEQKLLRLPAMMATAAGRREGERRAQVMRDYLAAFRLEIQS
ncbi:MAG: hydrolase, partial [Bdellovibrionaceae bacterium]|nr:hydrolase [Pseudobdellovibrionaceae bacterium]